MSNNWFGPAVPAVPFDPSGPPGPAGPAGPPGPAGPSDADQVTFVPCNTLTETNVQDALCELQQQVAARIPTVKSSIFIEDNATATVVTQNVAVKVAGTFLAGPVCQSCSYNGNRITYNGTDTTRVLVVASADITSSPNQTFLLEVRRNGQPVDGARCKVRVGTAIANGSLNAFAIVNTGDFLELWVTNITGAANPTVVDATLALMN